MCFAPQLRAIFDLSAPQMAPHPPLWRAYFLILRSHRQSTGNGKTWRFATFLPIRAPKSSFFWPFFLSSLFWLFPPLLLSILSEVWLLNFSRLVKKRVRVTRLVQISVNGAIYLYHTYAVPNCALWWYCVVLGLHGLISTWDGHSIWSVAISGT